MVNSKMFVATKIKDKFLYAKASQIRFKSLKISSTNTKFIINSKAELILVKLVMRLA